MQQLKAIAVVLTCYFMAKLLVVTFAWGAPASVVGMLILFLGLITKLVPLELMQSLSNWVMANMSVLFVPVIVALLAVERDLISNFAALLLGTILATLIQLMLVMAGLKKWR